MYKQKITDNVWKNLNGNVEFSPDVFQTAESLTDEQFENFGVYKIAETNKPQANHTFNVHEGNPEYIDGQWTQTWIVSDASAEEIEQRTVDQAHAIRNDRAQCLNNCDWTQLTDAPLTDEQKNLWAIYRQSLRNIPQQSGFPWEVEWPQKPE